MQTKKRFCAHREVQEGATVGKGELEGAVGRGVEEEGFVGEGGGGEHSGSRFRNRDEKVRGESEEYKSRVDNGDREIIGRTDD